MKKYYLTFLILMFSTIAGAYDLDKIRLDYISAINDSKKADLFYKQLLKIPSPEPVIQAYLGSAAAVRAKHAWNPVNKLSYLNEGFKIIDKAVKRDPNQLEVRFLRFSLAHYLPSFLGKGGNLTTDKLKIIDLIKKNELATMQVNQKVLKDMVNFMIDSKRCSKDEVVFLKTVKLNG